MNKTFNINLGGYPFAIDEVAYNYVQHYLDKIRQHFASSEGCDEILYDIEVRMAELFTEHLKGRTIVSMKEVDEIVMIMGKPEDFGAEPMEESAQNTYSKQSASSHSNRSKSTYGTGKRLFRDPDDKKVGGVCSGIAAYFGVEDPLWVRLIFVAFIFIGISPFLYFVLWILVPEATTSSDKLAMRGEPTTINNIAKVIETELTDLGARINEWGNEINDEYGPKSKDKKKSSSMKTESFTHQFVSGGVNVIGGVASSIASILSTVFRGSFKMLAILMVGALAVAWIASLFGITWATPMFVLAGPKSNGLSYLGIFSGLVFIVLPMIGLMFWIIKLIWGYRIHPNLKSGMWVAWFLSIFTTSFAAMTTAREYQTSFTATQKDQINISDPTINLSSLPYNTDEMGVSFGNFMYERDNVYAIRNANVTIEKSPDQNVYIEKKLSARGQTTKDAEANILVTANQYAVTGNKITFDPFITIPKTSKFRGQEVDYILYVPVGKKVVLDNEFRNIVHSSNTLSWDELGNDQVSEWTISNSDFNSHAKSFENLGNISKVIIESPMEVNIVKGAKNEVKLVGNRKWVESTTVKNVNGTLTVLSDNFENQDAVVITITLAQDIELLELLDVAKASIKGIHQNKLKFISISERHNPQISIDGQIKNLDIYIKGRQYLDLIGDGDNLTLNLEDDANINANKYIVSTAMVTGNDHDWSDSKIHVTKTLSLTPNMEDITVLGSPTIKKEEEKN